MATKIKIYKSRIMCSIKLITIVTLSASLTQAQLQYFQQPLQGLLLPINTNLDECQAAKIPCGGHTQSSCMKYCSGAGYTKGTCDGSCCLCSNNEIATAGQKQHQFSNTAYFNIGASTNRRGNSARAFVLPQQYSWYDLSGNSLLQKEQPKPTPANPARQTVQGKYSNLYNAFSNKNRFPQNTPVSSGKDVCTSSACHDEALVIKSQMNERVDPCDDFYEFACGSFQRQHIIGRDETEVTHFSILRDKVAAQLRPLFEERIERYEAKPFQLVKTMYKSCMNTAAIESQGFQPLINAIDEVGGWPVLDGDAWQPHDDYKWENFVVWYREMGFGLDYFMKVSVEPDLRNVGKRYITIGEPGLGVTDHVLKRGLNEPVVNAYYEFMTDTAVMMGADRTRAKKEMLDAVNFEINMAKCFHRPDNSRSGNFYNPMTIEQLRIKYPFIPWLAFFQRLMPSTVSITEKEVIMVSVPQYMDCFFDLLRRSEQKTMVNYVVWRAISSTVVYLHEPARSLQHNFLSKLTGQKDRKPRWKQCTEIVQTNLGNAVGAMYIRRYFNDASKAQAMEMVKDIRQAFLDILNENTWMDAYTKGKAKEKALEMLVHIGYPEEHKSDAMLTPVYANFQFKENDYFGNIRNLVSGAMSIMFGKLKEPNNRNDWLTQGHNAVVNAFYQPQENSIKFPAAILQGHFFNATRPKYLNYASIGWIMGHEISHGFDDQGHQFDKHGNLLNWWAESTKQTYNQKKKCIVDQYSEFQADGIRLNGERSQGENIADNGGIKQAYRGYKYWVGRNGHEKGLPGLAYTSNQLFWISAAQNWCSVQRKESLRHNIVTGVHSPPEFRVRGTFCNSEDFNKDFQCSRGRKMNPIRKCSVW